MNSAWTWTGLGLSAALSCAVPARGVDTPPAQPLPGTSSAASAAPAASVVPSPAASAQAPPARLERVSAPVDEKAHVEILFPFAEQRILIPKAAGYTVRTKVLGWPLAAEGRGVVIALDHHRPRRLLDKSDAKLGSLVDEGSELSPGPHWLTLAAVDQDQSVVRGNGGSRAPFALVRFWVGDRDPKRSPTPHVVVLSPAGTYNGESPSSAIAIDFLAAPDRLGKGGARVRVAGSGVQLDQRLIEWQPLSIRGLPSGDFEVEVNLLDEHGDVDEKSRAVRTISVNRELASGAAQKP